MYDYGYLYRSCDTEEFTEILGKSNSFLDEVKHSYTDLINIFQTEYSQYRIAIEKWKKETGKEPVAHGIRAKLAEKKQEIQNEQKNKQHTRSQNKDRGAR